jgi:hypothetical protein
MASQTAVQNAAKEAGVGVEARFGLRVGGGEKENSTRSLGRGQRGRKRSGKAGRRNLTDRPRIRGPRVNY